MPSLIECAQSVTESLKGTLPFDSISPDHPWIQTIRMYSEVSGADTGVDLFLKEAMDGVELVRKAISEKGVDASVTKIEGTKILTKKAAQKLMEEGRLTKKAVTPVEGIPDYVTADLEHGFSTQKIKAAVRVAHWDPNESFLSTFYDPTKEVPNLGANPDKVSGYYAKYVNAYETFENQFFKAVDEDLSADTGTILGNFAAKIRQGRGIVTDKRAVTEAQKLIDVPDAIEQFLNLQPGQALNKEAITALSGLAKSSFQAWQNLNRSLPIETRTPEQIARLKRAGQLAQNLQMVASGAATEAGRALQALRNTRMLSAQDILKQYSPKLTGKSSAAAPVELHNGVKLSAEKYEEFSDSLIDAMGKLDPDNQLEIDAFFTNLHRGTGSEMVMEAWYNGVLSNPSTFAINMIGNEITRYMDMTCLLYTSPSPRD